ncbi:MAG TPA: peptide MFS transporter [Steroidobacteraceae bacterium]|nr:peptide MFS transporter [Steroidobacteraceae bacterium]
MRLLPAFLRAHPPGLALLFLTETWERFSYYGMRALLVLYMTEQLLLAPTAQHVLGYEQLHRALEGVFGPLGPQAMASQIYGLYTSLLYFTPFFGGLLADRLLGQYRTVILGALIMALGHFLMASETFFLFALLCIIVGNGCFKPNVSTQVGQLYARTDSRRDSAFSIFYMGINLGATIAPMVCGTLGEIYGWHYGFVTAGVGMLAGLAIYVGGRKHLPRDVARDPPVAQVPPAAQVPPGSRRATDLKAIAALCLVAFVITFFWAAYEQQGNAIVLWVRDFTDRSFFGLFELRTTWFLSLNPLFIFLLTPLLVAWWTWTAGGRAGMSPATKMAVGCLFACAAYGILVLAVAIGGARVSWAWMVLFFILLTLAELHVSPVALSLFSRAAPAWAASMMMGVWFMSGVVGNYLAGVMGSFWERLPKDTFWALAGAVPLFAGLIMLGLRGLLDRIILEQQALDAPR